jgi:hypothetical protein
VTDDEGLDVARRAGRQLHLRDTSAPDARIASDKRIVLEVGRARARRSPSDSEQPAGDPLEVGRARARRSPSVTTRASAEVGARRLVSRPTPGTRSRNPRDRRLDRLAGEVPGTQVAGAGDTQVGHDLGGGVRQRVRELDRHGGVSVAVDEQHRHRLRCRRRSRASGSRSASVRPASAMVGGRSSGSTAVGRPRSDGGTSQDHRPPLEDRVPRGPRRGHASASTGPSEELGRRTRPPWRARRARRRPRRWPAPTSTAASTSIHSVAPRCERPSGLAGASGSLRYEMVERRQARVEARARRSAGSRRASRCGRGPAPPTCGPAVPSPAPSADVGP